MAVDFGFIFAGGEAGDEVQLLELSCVFIGKALVLLHNIINITNKQPV